MDGGRRGEKRSSGGIRPAYDRENDSLRSGASGRWIMAVADWRTHCLRWEAASVSGGGGG